MKPRPTYPSSTIDDEACQRIIVSQFTHTTMSNNEMSISYIEYCDMVEANIQSLPWFVDDFGMIYQSRSKHLSLP